MTCPSSKISPSSSAASSTSCRSCACASSGSRTCPRCRSTSPACWTPCSSSASGPSSASRPIRALTKTFTIGGTTARAHSFLFGDQSADAQPGRRHASSLQAFLSNDPLERIAPSALAERLKQQDEALAHGANGGGGDPLTTLALDDPKQWSMSWTTFPDVYALGVPHLDEWAATVDVTQPDKATEAFFPTIARYGLAYNLLLPQKVQSAGRGNVAGALRRRLDAGARRGRGRRPAVRDRPPDLRDAGTPAGPRRDPLHAEHRRRPGAGRRRPRP